MNIESQSYVATPADITTLTREMYGAQMTAVGHRQTYLRALAATTVAELKEKPRLRSQTGKIPRLNEEGIQRQLAALIAVHDRFYPAVLEAVSNDLPAGKARAIELNRRGNFARTALSALRGYIRAGNDLTAINVTKLTKESLRVAHVPRAPSPTRLKTRTETRSKLLMESLIALAEVDKAAAVSELELLMGQLATQAAELGLVSVRDPKQSTATGAPLRIGSRVFIPTQTQILRQRATPS